MTVLSSAFRLLGRLVLALVNIAVLALVASTADASFVVLPEIGHIPQIDAPAMF